jgi:MFS family permease
VAAHEQPSGAHAAGVDAAPPRGQAGDRLWTSDFAFATLANLANAFGLQMMVAVMPVHVLELGGSRAEAGLVGGAVAFFALLCRPFVGWLTDAWRRRPLVLAGTACYSLASVVYLLAGTIPALLAGRAVHGAGVCCYTTAANAYLADIAPPRRRAEALGLFAAMQDIGLITGPAVGFLLLERIGFRRLFLVSASLAALAFLVSLLARERRQPPAKIVPWSPRTGVVAVEALPLAWTALCLGLAFGAVNALVAIFARARGVANPGYYFTVQALALLASRTFAGRLADRHGYVRVVVPGVVLMAVALAWLPFGRSFPEFTVSASLFGLGFGAAQPATMALLVGRVREERRGLATGTYFTGFDAGISVGAITGGIVSQRCGFGAMWGLAAACTLLGLASLRGPGSSPAPVSPPPSPAGTTRAAAPARRW